MQRTGIAGRDKILGKISKALKTFATKATQE